MAKRRRLVRSRLREKAACAPALQLGRYEKSILKYFEEVKPLRGEPARFHRFTILLNDLFGGLDFPVLREFLSGLETTISGHEAEKCRVLRGRPDALYGNLVIEFERSLPAKLKEAKKQLERYIAILNQHPETQDTAFIPIAGDGVTFIVFAPEEEAEVRAMGDAVRLEKIEEFQLNEHNPIAFYYWLDRYFLREHKRKPDTENFLQDFGPQSPAFRFASVAWMEEIAHYRHQSDFKIIYANWQKYLRIAYGTAVGDERLFVRHTYLATLAKLLAYVRITNAQAPPPENETREILQGTFFEKQRILNFLEEDFFSWVGRDSVLSASQRIVSRLVNLLFSYNVRELSEDVLKELYQGLVDPKDRHDLGEYYTPDWLAARMCAKMLGKSGEEAVLDPACGSGTFLYQAIQHKKKHLPHTRQSLEKILGTVVGIDIHPLAVIVSKMNVLWRSEISSKSAAGRFRFRCTWRTPSATRSSSVIWAAGECLPNASN